jgi:NADPH-dependent curcumin reductase CurA
MVHSVLGSCTCRRAEPRLRKGWSLCRRSRIRYREETGPGLEAATEAFIALLAGRNFGKTLVRVS